MLSSNRTTVSSDISFSFFLFFSVFSASNESMDNRGGSYFFRLLEDKSRETGTLCWSGISTAKQSSGVFFKKKIFSRWVQLQGAWMTQLSLRLANQVVPPAGTQHFDWLISRGEALPSSLTWVFSVVAISERSSNQRTLRMDEIHVSSASVCVCACVCEWER